MIRSTMLGAAAAALFAAAPAQAEFTGQIVMSGFGVCPPGTLAANGNLLPIQKEKPASGDDYRDLYLLYGTAYGGDGETTFALPDMRPQMLAMNNLGRGAPMLPAAAKDKAPAMRVELPIVFCVVLHGGKPAK
jgi:microcystin-dependent protein